MLAERSEDVARLAAIVERQQALIDRALRLAESGRARRICERSGRSLAALHERSQALIDRALAQLETRDAELTKVTGLLDRAMDAATALDAEVARQTDMSRIASARCSTACSRSRRRASTGSRRPAAAGWFARWRSERESGK